MLGLERWLRLGKKRPFKHERQKGVWSGFERDFVTCSPYVSAFHQLCSDLKQVASLPNKPQLLQRLLRCNLCYQCVKNPYMGQNRDSLTHELCQRGGKKAVVCSVQEGTGLTCPFGAVFLARHYSQLDLLSAFTMSKTLILTFLFAPTEVLWKSLSVRLTGCLTGLPCFQVRNGSTPTAFPTAEFGDSGKTLVPCSVLQQLMGISPKPGVASLPRRPEVVLLFLGLNLELANMQVLLQIGSVAWEQCLVLQAMLL